MPSVVEMQPAAAQKPLDVELKRIPYRGNTAGYDGILDYVILPGNRCVYSGIVKGHAQSTINAAESIIQAIAEREEYELNELQFFDLETCRGYDSFKVEKYEFSNIVLKLDGRGNLHDVGFNRAKCPADVLEIFREHIGTITVPTLSHAEALEQGFDPETYDPSMTTQEEIIDIVREMHDPKPETLQCFTIVDRATIPGVEVSRDDRYELRLRKPETIARESRWSMKGLESARQKVETWKNHGLSQEELHEIAELFHHELSRYSSSQNVPYSQQLEYLMRPVLAILDKNPGAGYIWNKFRGAIEGLFSSLYFDMPGFAEAVRGDAEDSVAQALIKNAQR